MDSPQELYVLAEPESQDAFEPATVIAERADGSLRVRTSRGERVVRLNLDAWPRSSSPSAPADLCSCDDLHTPALLHTLRHRFENERSYATWMHDRVLVWLHPCGPTPDIFTVAHMLQAAAATDGVDTTADPNVFTLAERALRTARGGSLASKPPAVGGAGARLAASILLHGETGAGQSDLFLQIGSHWLWRTADPYGMAAGASASGSPIPSKSGSPIARMLADGGTMLSDGGSILANGELCLMAFGAARTKRNASTPRFGRCLRLGLDGRGAATSVSMNAFGLESSRVLSAGGEPEGNFHCYYSVLHLESLQYYTGSDGIGGNDGSGTHPYPPPSPTKEGGNEGAGGGGGRTGRAPPSDFAMLRSNVSRCEGSHRSPIDLERLRDALGAGGLGCTGREIAHLWCVLEGMLHLSNLLFTDDATADVALGSSSAEEVGHGGAHAAELQACSTLLGLPHLAHLLWEDDARVGVSGSASRGSVSAIRRTAKQASEVRQALMEEVHSALFHILLAKLNHALAKTVTRARALAQADDILVGNSIGAGGEVGELLCLSPPPSEALALNGLPQLLAQYASERLHSLFITRSLAAEQRRYADEGIGWLEAPLPESSAVLLLLDGRNETDDAFDISVPSKGAADKGPLPLLTMLDVHARGSASSSKKGSSSSDAAEAELAAASRLTSELKRLHGSSIALADSADTRRQTASSSSSSFVVHHTSASLVYDAKALLAGSRGSNLSRKCKAVLFESSNLLLKQIGDSYLGTTNSSSAGGGRAGGGRRANRSPAASFTAELRSALHACERCEMRHALCIAPNASDVPNAFEPRVVMRQLNSLGVASATYFLANSYSERLPLLAVTGKLRTSAPPAWAHLAPRAFVHALLVAAGLKYLKHFQIGRTAALVRTQARWGGAAAYGRIARLMAMPEQPAKIELTALVKEHATRQLDATMLLTMWVRRFMAKHRERRKKLRESADGGPPGKRQRGAPAAPRMIGMPPPPNTFEPGLMTPSTHKTVGFRDESSPNSPMNKAIDPKQGRHDVATGGTLTLVSLEAMADAAMKASAPCPPEWARDPPLGHARVVLVLPNRRPAGEKAAPDTLKPEAKGPGALMDAAAALGMSTLQKMGKRFSIGSGARGGGPAPSPPPSPPNQRTHDYHRPSHEYMKLTDYGEQAKKGGERLLEWVAGGLTDAVSGLTEAPLPPQSRRHSHDRRHSHSPDRRHSHERRHSHGDGHHHSHHRHHRHHHRQPHASEVPHSLYGVSSVAFDGTDLSRKDDMPIAAELEETDLETGGAADAVASVTKHFEPPPADRNLEESAIVDVKVEQPLTSLDEATDVRILSSTLRDWDRPTLNGSFLPQLVALDDPPKAIALSGLLRCRVLTTLNLRECRLGEQCAHAIGELLRAIPITTVDLRDNQIGEKGLIALANGVQHGGTIAEMRLQHALPTPFTPTAVEALAIAAGRCASLKTVFLGETDAKVAGSNGPLAKLQANLIVNHETEALILLPKLAWGTASPPPSPPPSPPQEGGGGEAAADDGLGSAIDAMRLGGLHTLRLAHEPTAARATLPRQLELLRTMIDCRSLRVAQLVNVGLGDAWGRALVAALPRMAHLRVLDVTHNYIGSANVKGLADALSRNHSLLWVQLLPQWLKIDREAERALGQALSTRRVKLDLAVRAAKGVLSSRGDVGEPSVTFEWRGSMMSTGSAQPSPATLNPRWESHFNVCVPASLLWPPGRTPITLSLLDLRQAAQLSSDPPMGYCELPLGSLLLAEQNVGVRCAVQRHPSAARVKGSAELHLELSIVHVGPTHTDDDAPGPPQAFKLAIAEQHRVENEAVGRVQKRWRGNKSRQAFTDVIHNAKSRTCKGRLRRLLQLCKMWLFSAVQRATSAVSSKQSPLLPMSVERSDDTSAVEDTEARERKRALLRLALCLLCGAIILLLAAAGAVLLMLYTGGDEHEQLLSDVL